MLKLKSVIKEVKEARL